LFISEWDERCDWLQTTAEHDVVWSIFDGNHGELSYAPLNWERQFQVKYHTQYVEGIHDNPVTLKSRLTVTQRQWKQNHW